MKNNTKKKAVVFAMLSLLTVGVAFSLSGNNELQHIDAAECAHVCNHYTKRSSGNGASGCKEYWVCCECHEHWLTAPTSQTITDMGQATVTVDSSDDRYIAPNCNSDDLYALGFGTVNENPDGTYEVGDFDKGKQGVIIPEGVTELQSGTFMGNKHSWVVIPRSLEPNISSSDFKAANKYTILYFVGDTTHTSDSLAVTGLYKIEGSGWHYDSNNVPQPGAN